MAAPESEKILTRRQKESMQILMKALTDFVLEDNHEHEDISDYDSDDLEDRSSREAPKIRLGESAFRSPHAPEKVHRYPQGNEKLISNCKALIGETIRLEYSLRTMGSGGPGMYGAWSLRQSLRSMLAVLQDVDLDELVNRDIGSYRLSERYGLGQYIDNLPTVLNALSKAFFDLESFLLDFVSVFHSVSLGHVLRSLGGTLLDQYHDLQEFKNETSISPIVGLKLKYRLVDFFSELDARFETCISELSDFRREGTPLIRSARRAQSDRYLTLTTISTFFSAVTSATLQIAFQQSSDRYLLTVAVNTFFFSSLIFSTASAVQSLLAMAWQRSFIRLPEGRWMFTWVSKGPLLSLVVAGAFFAIGLCLFVFSSQTSSITSACTIVFAVFHAIGLIAASIWLVYEQWKFRQQSGPIGRKLTQTSTTMAFLAWVSKTWQLYFASPSVWLRNPFRRPVHVDHVSVEKSNLQEQDDADNDDCCTSSSDINIRIEPPSRQESVASDHSSPPNDSDLPSDALKINIDMLDEQYEATHVVDTVLGMGIVEEPTSLDRSLHDFGPGRITADRIPFVSDLFIDPDDALSPSQTAELDVRRATWEQDLHQDSISYMEMYNRANHPETSLPPFRSTGIDNLSVCFPNVLYLLTESQHILYLHFHLGTVELYAS